MGKAVVIFVGNILLRDDGVGPACCRLFLERYDIGEDITLMEVGCMTADLVNVLGSCDFVLSVDALDVSQMRPGTVLRYPPDAMARLEGRALSLHDLRLADLFDMALLMDFECEGFCLGMQIEDIEPEQFAIGLTAECQQALPLLAEAVADELVKRGYDVVKKVDGCG